QILGVPHLGRDVAGDGRHLHRDQLLRGQRTRKKQNERESKNETHAKNLRGTNTSADAQAMPAEHGKRYEKGDSPGERPGQLARGPAPAGLYGPSSRTACAANDASIACSIFKGRRVKPKSRNVAKSWRIELTLRRP